MTQILLNVLNAEHQKLLKTLMINQHQKKVMEGWEERFQKEFIREDGLLDVGKYDFDILYLFIKKEIAKAKGEERERIEKIVKGNHKGSFSDECGNECWYIDDLVKIINLLKD